MRLNVNGRARDVRAEPGTPLLTVLRDELGLTGPKFGCGLGQCGACTVMIDGAARRSCRTPVERVGEARVVTIEGLGNAQHPGPVQQAFIAEQAAQCGYCIPGMVVAATALLTHNAKPSDAQIKEALRGNLCRCGTHLRIVRAIKRAAGESV